MWSQRKLLASRLHFKGFAMLWITLALSAVLLLVVNLSARKSNALIAACLLCGASLAAGLFAFRSPAFLLHALLLGIAALSCLFANASPRAVLASSLAATLSAYGSAFALSSAGLSTGFAEARPFAAKTAVVPNSDSDGALSDFNAETNRPISDNAAFAMNGDFEPLRMQLLRTLHDRHVQLFVKSPGSGVERMPTMHKLRKNLLAKEVFPLPESEGDFEIPKDAPTWHIDRLELVSLLKHDPPAAYASGDVTVSMLAVHDARTRPLDAFEESSLQTLKEGSEIKVQSERDVIHMLGAIRAGGECLRCHTSSKKGDLLGAFSYKIRRETPKP
jgi:hypothetical protein